jgi:uncharacterized membrane protein YeaQ/YmgE (transglycosylase-associated protein family)
MTGLRDILPDRDVVLRMRPEELAPILLRIVPSHIQNGMFITETVGQVQSGRGYNHFAYVDGSDREVERATSEAWAWLERQGLIMHPGNKYEPKGFILTTLLGIVGAFVATYLGQAIGWYQAGQGAGFIGAIVGAIIVLVVWGMIAPRLERT